MGVDDYSKCAGRVGVGGGGSYQIRGIQHVCVCVCGGGGGGLN